MARDLHRSSPRDIPSSFPSSLLDSWRTRRDHRFVRGCFSVNDIILRRYRERREEESVRARARDSWQPVTKGHEVLAPLLRLVVGGYRDVLILPRVPRGEIDTHRDPFPFPSPSPLPHPFSLRRALIRVFARDGLALIDLARRTLIADEKKKGGGIKKKEKRKNRGSPIPAPLPKTKWSRVLQLIKSRDTRVESMRKLLDLARNTLWRRDTIEVQRCF